jgi:chromosome segregation ATPase
MSTERIGETPRPKANQGNQHSSIFPAQTEYLVQRAEAAERRVAELDATIEHLLARAEAAERQVRELEAKIARMEEYIACQDAEMERLASCNDAGGKVD